MATSKNPFWEPTVGIGVRRRESPWAEADASAPTADRQYLGKALSRKQLLVVGALAAIAIVSLVGRAFQLQVMRGSTYRGLAEGNSVRSEIIPAPRGLFYDQYGRVLTENIPDLSLAFIPYQVPANDAARESSFATVSTLTAVPVQTLDDQWQKLSDARRKAADPILVDAPLTADAQLKLQLSQAPHPGLALVTTAKRQVVTTDGANISLAHVIGYVGRVGDADLSAAGSSYTSTDNIGKDGLELVYENILRGVNGHRDVEVNALGQPQGAEVVTSPVAGQHVWLTIDADMQAVLTTSLEKQMQAAHVTRGAAIVMNPQTGAVLALVSLPTFDANAFNQGISASDYAKLANNPDHPLIDRMVQGLYPSGSTIKPIYAVAALAEGLITPTTTVLSVGGIHVGPYFFPDWKAGGHGITDVKKALADSVNTFFYTIGGGYGNITGLGIERMAQWAAKFGIGKITGIDLPNEMAGLFPTPEWKTAQKNQTWYIGDTYHVAIGQGDLLVTPLQIASFTNAFANGGTLYQPHLVSEIVSADGQSRQKISPTVLATNVAPADDIEVVRQGMRETITDGSARSLQSVPFPVAGKTGTAQNPFGNPHAWFTGFGPYDNPQLAITVLLENAGEGSTYAVPVARDVFTWWGQNRMEK